MEFAAFIMTYRRPECLSVTVQKLKEQTLAPKYILVVDNCPDASAEQLASSLDCGYYHVGHNSGPAGGAYYGLKILFEEGWQWVTWVDDDDPPILQDQFASIFSILNKANEQPDIGMLGAVGSLFDYNTVEIKRIPDEQLKGVLEVDMIAGNQFPTVNRKLFEADLLPTPGLFFGFEDLEYSLRVRKAGFSILVSGELMYALRRSFNKIGYQKPLYKKKTASVLWREYYSTRTMVFMLKHQLKVPRSLSRYKLKIMAKCLYGFKYGWQFGKENCRILIRGWNDGIAKRLGITVPPVSKKASIPVIQ